MLDTASKTALRIILVVILAYGLGVVHRVLSHPELLGQWDARRDIGYDSVWGEYLSDCDCMQPVE